VTQRSDQQVRQFTRKIHRENPRARIILTGCYAQRDPDSVAQVEGVSLVAGNTEKNKLVQLMDLDGGKTSDAGSIFNRSFEKKRSFNPSSALPIGDKTRPLVKIQDGCDARCSYCIVPTVRGPSRSIPPELILEQVQQLLQQGFREIVLTGIHMGTYGMHLQPRVPLNRLIERITGLPGTWRLRLSSIEPMELSRKVIDLAASSEKVAPHFHICLQSGSDRILKKMLRPYNKARFASIVEEIHRKIPAAGIGTDVISGFPGESVEDHRRTIEFLKELPFSYFHVFPYSDRSGTLASDMPDKVSSKVIKERSRELRELSACKNSQFRKSFIGKEIVSLTLSEQRGGFREALTGNYLRHLVPIGIPGNQLFTSRVTEDRDGFLISAGEAGQETEQE
jgi:threonylcarbamoyladenosine tRNA methylthiotransferase MtaB